MLKTSKEALANHLGWDIADLKDARYQSTQYNSPVYSISNDYFCATPEGKAPAKPMRKGVDPFNWVEVPSFVNQYGFKIYKHSSN